MSILISLNILTVLEVIGRCIGKSIVPPITFLVVSITVLPLGYFVFVYNSNYKKLPEEFGYETSSQRKKRTAAFVIYVILSLVVGIALLAVRR